MKKLLSVFICIGMLLAFSDTGHAFWFFGGGGKKKNKPAAGVTQTAAQNSPQGAGSGTTAGLSAFTAAEATNGAKPVPEPSTLILLGAGLAGLAVGRRKMRGE